jgi:hypothetical protein
MFTSCKKIGLVGRVLVRVDVALLVLLLLELLFESKDNIPLLMP